MKDLAFIQPPPVYIEIGLDSFRVVQDNAGLELPLERSSNGRLTVPCRETLAARLKAFLKREKWQLPPAALCALSGSGAAVRRVTLPPAPKGDFQRLLLLQIEREFPLSPDELAWGYVPLSAAPANGTPVAQELLVAAVKNEVLEEYTSALVGGGLRPVFTLAGLARSRFCPNSTEPYSILDLDRRHCEWITFENNVPIVLRVFPWGGENLEETEGALDLFVRSLRNQAIGRTIFLTGAADYRQLAEKLSPKLGEGIECRWIEAESGAGRSAAILGLKQWSDTNDGTLPLTLRTKPRPIAGATAMARIANLTGKFLSSDPVLRERAVLGLILLLSLLALPYAQAFVLKPFVAHKIAVIESQRDRLTTIDRELSFLQYVKQNSPPYLDALYLFAKAAPSGTSLESVTMNERGEISLSGALGSYQQVLDFRSALIKSGFFSNVSVEEQTPGPQRKLTVRITAQWKPAQARALLNIGPTADEIARAGQPAGSANGQAGPSASFSPEAAPNGPAGHHVRTHASASHSTNAAASASVNNQHIAEPSEH